MEYIIVRAMSFPQVIRPRIQRQIILESNFLIIFRFICMVAVRNLLVHIKYVRFIYGK